MLKYLITILIIHHYSMNLSKEYKLNSIGNASNSIDLVTQEIYKKLTGVNRNSNLLLLK